jgi:hypothetical protein
VEHAGWAISLPERGFADRAGTSLFAELVEAGFPVRAWRWRHAVAANFAGRAACRGAVAWPRDAVSVKAVDTWLKTVEPAASARRIWWP